MFDTIRQNAPRVLDYLTIVQFIAGLIGIAFLPSMVVFALLN